MKKFLYCIVLCIQIELIVSCANSDSEPPVDDMETLIQYSRSPADTMEREFYRAQLQEREQIEDLMKVIGKNKKKKTKQKTSNYLELAEKELKRGNWEQALRYARNAAGYCAKVEGWNLVAITHARSGSNEWAEHYFSKASDTASAHGRNIDTITLNWAQTLLDAKQYNAAIEKYGQLSSALEDPLQLYNRGTAYLHIGQYEQAIGDFEQSVKMDGSKDAFYNLAVAHYAKGDFEKALDNVMKSRDAGKWNESVYLLAGKCHLKLNQEKEALEYFRSALRENRDCMEALHALGVLYANMDRPREADAMFSRMLKIDTASSMALTGLAGSAIRDKRFPEALALFNKAIAADSLNFSAYTGRGNTHCHLGNYEDAAIDYNYSISLHSENPYAYQGLGVAYFRLRNYSMALISLQRVKDMDVNFKFSYDALISKGFSNYQLGLYYDALEDFKGAVALEPRRATGYNGMGCVYYQMQSYTESVRSYSDALKYAPADDVIWTNRGNANYRAHDYAVALQDFAKALSIQPANEHALNGLGICNHSMDQYDAAIQFIQQAIDIDPDNDRLYLNLGFSRGHLVKQLRDLGKDSLATVHYELMIQDHLKVARYEDRQLNLGVLHSHMEDYDKANDLYNSIGNRYYDRYVNNNKAVVLALRDEGQNKVAAYELFSEVVMEDDSIIAEMEKPRKYMEPRYNMALLGSSLNRYVPFDLVNTTPSGKNGHYYYNTYFYYSLMRYAPPPTEHGFLMEVAVKDPEPVRPSIEYVFLSTEIPCFKPKSKKVGKVKDRSPCPPGEIGCPEFRD